MSRKSYDDLTRENRALKSRLELLEKSMKTADRAIVRYFAIEWVSIPLHRKQVDAVREVMGERKRYGDCQRFSDHKLYEEIHECNVLPEFRHLLMRYTTDLEGNDLDVPQIWGLVPV